MYLGACKSSRAPLGCDQNYSGESFVHMDGFHENRKFCLEQASRAGKMHENSSKSCADARQLLT